MPHLAFELDALKQVPDCARAADLPEEKLGYGLLRLWNYCWTEKRDRVTETHLLGFFGGTLLRVVPALCAFRFVENCGPDEFRVRGAERYLRISRGRSEGGKAASGNLKRGRKEAGGKPEKSPGLVPALAGEEPEKSPGLPPALHRTPNTEHRAPTTTTKPPPKPPPPAPPSTAEAAEAEMAGDGQGAWPPTAFGFYGWWQSERRNRSLLPEARDPPRELLAWHAEVEAEAGIPGVIRCAQAYLGDAHFGAKGWPLRVLMSPDVWRTRAAETKPKRSFRL